MTELHARLDLLDGTLSGALVGAAAGVSSRRFAVLTLTRGDGTAGIGEASPLPGYSPDSIDEACSELRRLVEEPVEVDALGTPFEIVSSVLAAHPVRTPSARFAIETALLDWLGHTRAEPAHRVLAGDVTCDPIPIAELVLEPDPARWPAAVDVNVAAGATHLKLKVGVDLAREVAALTAIRAAHPTLRLRLDGNGRASLDALRAHASSLEALGLELFEEPVPRDQWSEALELPLPFALDESLRDREHAKQLLESGRIRAVVLKPTVLGGLEASFEVAELGARFGASCLVSHTFDGPIARAAAVELALALRAELAAGLGTHPALDLWPPYRIDAVRARTIAPHDSPGLGLHFEDQDE